MNSLVSAIITTYNRDPVVLRRAINSVLSQTYENVELIVVNDSPSYEKRNEIDDLICELKIRKYIVNPTSKGAGFSRNRGFEASEGEFIAYLDDDDEWLPTKIERMVKDFKPNVGLVYCDMIMCCRNGEKVQKMKEYPQSQIMEKLLDRNYIGGFSAPIIRASALEECGKMDESLPSSQDSDLWRRIAAKNEIIHHREPLVRYYISNDSITGNSERRFKGTIILLDKYSSLYKRFPNSRRNHVNRSVQNYIRSGWMKEAISLYKYAYPGFFDRMKYSYIFFTGVVKKVLR